MVSTTKGHIFEYIGWHHGTKVLQEDDIATVDVVLKDVTKDETITRKGKVYMMRPPTVFINSLEGCKDVHVCVVRGEHAKVVCSPSDGCKLQAIEDQ